MRPRLLETVLVLLGYVVLTVGLTWPLAAQFTTTLPDGGDSWRYLWNLWWAKTSLLDLHTDFFHTDFLYYPNGVSLYVDTPTPLLGAIGIPLQLLGLNLVTVYNILLALSFVVAGYGTYLLVKYLTGNKPAAFVSGIVFAFSPYHFAHMLGHLNIASIQWIPLYVLALLKAVEWQQTPEPTTPEGGEDRGQNSGRRFFNLSATQVGWALVAGIWLAVVSYTEWTYTAFLLLFTLFVLIWQLAQRHRPEWRSYLVPAALAIAMWLALTAPVLVPMLQEERSTGEGQSSLDTAAYFGADLTDAFVPSLFHPLWNTLGIAMNDRWLTKPRPEKIVFVGYTVLLVAGATLIALRRQQRVLFWGFVALGAWLLSLGPVLYIWGRDVFFGLRIPLPYAPLYFVPFFNVMRVPSRFTVLVMLGLAVLVGYGLAAASKSRFRLGAREAGRVATVLVAILVIFEFLPVPYPMQALNYDEPVYHEIAQEPGRFGILDLPMTQAAIYEGYQTIHGKPIVGGYLARQPYDPFVDATPVLRYLIPSVKVDDPLSAQAAREGVAELRAANIRYVILHELTSPTVSPDEQALRDKIARVFAGITPRVIQGKLGTLTIYRLTP